MVGTALSRLCPPYGVEFDANNETVKTRKAMEAAFTAEH
jgi:hypothetical protein